MKKFYVLCLIFGCLFGGSGLALTHTKAASLPSLYISEVNWAGSPLSLADEWIEITNGSRETVDLSGWIVDGAASSGGAIQIATGVSIAPLSSVLIANYDSGNEKSTLSTKPDLVTSAISLANTNLTLRLVDPTGVVVDVTAFGSSPSAGSTNPFASAIRLNDGSFATATVSIGLTTTAQFGTPKTVDLAVEHTTTDESPSTESLTDESSSAEELVTEPETEIDQVLESTTDSSAPCCGCSCNPISSLEETSSSEPEQSEADTYTAPTNDELTSPDLSNQNFLQLSEFVSDPEDGIEWVEFYNESESVLHLDGMYITDATLSKTMLAGVIEPGAHGVIENPKGKLNNDTDQIHLYTHNDTKIDQIEYGTSTLKAAKKGESIGRIQDAWHVLATPTKGYANIANMIPTPEPVAQEVETESSEIIETTSEEPDNTAVQETTQAPTEELTEPEDTTVVTVVSIAEQPNTIKTKKSSSKSKSSKQEETVQGIVTVAPGALGKQIAYLEGYQVYFYKAQWPTLSIGDTVELKGTLSLVNNEPRFTIKSTDAITITGHSAIAARTFAPNEATSEQIGSVFTFEGIIQSREKQRVDIDINSADIRIELPKDVNGNLLPEDSLKGKGILRSDKNGFYLEVLSKSDLELATTATPNAPAVHGGKNSKSVAGAGIFTGTLGVVGYWLRKSLILS